MFIRSRAAGAWPRAPRAPRATVPVRHRTHGPRRSRPMRHAVHRCATAVPRLRRRSRAEWSARARCVGVCSVRARCPVRSGRPAVARRPTDDDPRWRSLAPRIDGRLGASSAAGVRSSRPWSLSRSAQHDVARPTYSDRSAAPRSGRPSDGGGVVRQHGAAGPHPFAAAARARPLGGPRGSWVRSGLLGEPRRPVAARHESGRCRRDTGRSAAARGRVPRHGTRGTIPRPDADGAPSSAPGVERARRRSGGPAELLWYGPAPLPQPVGSPAARCRKLHLERSACRPNPRRTASSTPSGPAT
jgi:hypothetical protein